MKIDFEHGQFLKSEQPNEVSASVIERVFGLFALLHFAWRLDEQNLRSMTSDLLASCLKSGSMPLADRSYDADWMRACHKKGT
ncbi:hypothetical protein J2R80_008344 [Bradyrhizobium sp. USDA 4541]|nr:hypothetical protein [Bradyrhizobium sp. USDA 4541]